MSMAFRGSDDAEADGAGTAARGLRSPTRQATAAEQQREAGFPLMRLLIFPLIFLFMFSSGLLPRAAALSQVRPRTEGV